MTNIPTILNLENDGSKAVFRLFDNAFNIIPQQPGNNFINTYPDMPYFQPVLITLDMKLITPMTMASFEYQAPYNPFVFLSSDRGRELHLPGYKPSHLADPSFWETYDDNTNPGLKQMPSERSRARCSAPPAYSGRAIEPSERIIRCQGRSYLPVQE